MKKLIAVMLFLPLFSFAQQYSAVVEIPNKTSDQLYITAKEWFIHTFNSSSDVIQMDDSIQKKFIGKGIKQIKWPIRTGVIIGNIIVESNVYFTLSINFKDNRYKYDIQSSEIKTLRGSSYTYNELKEICTEEGLRTYFKKMGLRWTLSKNQLQNSLEGNKLSLIECDKCLQGIVDDLTCALEKKDKTSNW